MGEADGTFSASNDPCWSAADAAEVETKHKQKTGIDQ